jgi:D-serine deaminase-like pyridoxal phosphate-dependent protein
VVQSTNRAVLNIIRRRQTISEISIEREHIVNEVGLPKLALDTPFLWVDLDVLEQNISRMAAFFQEAGVHWRPHIKGNKTPAIAHMLVDAGAIGLTCAKLGEAEVMAAEGIDDLLVVNQIVGQKKYDRLADLCRTADVKIAIDSTITLNALNAAAKARDITIGVVIEVNTGMNRAGVEPGQPVLDLARALQAYTNVQLRGLMTWEAHALGIEDEAVKRQTVAAAIGQLTESAERCRQAGFPIEIVSCGGSGTYMITANEPGITEIQAGGAIFKDMTYAAWNVPTEHALFVHRRKTTTKAIPGK